MPRNFTAEVLRYDDPDHQAANIINRKVTIKTLLNIHPVIHDQRYYEMLTRGGFQGDLGYKQSLLSTRSGFTEHLLHMRRMETLALIIGKV